jgi:hypothetical protein
MTLGTQTIIAERLSRTAGANTISNSSDVTKGYINEGVRRFSDFVHGIDTSTFIQLSPKFDAGRDFAIKFTIGGNVNTFGSADIPMVSSAINDATPTTLMGHFVSNVNATIESITISMAWSASTWTFQLYGPASATSIAIRAPTGVGYTDGVFSMFGKYATGTTTITGNIPQDCNLETSLPSGFMEMDYVYYGSWKLQKAPFDIFLRPRVQGTPSFYGIRNKQILLYPTPNHQDFCKIFYTGVPTELDTSGADDATECPLPSEIHMAPVYYAASMLLQEGHEYDKSVFNMQMFTNLANNYKIREANQNPSLYPSRGEYIPPKVII